jgi:chorismate mutase
MVWPGQDPLRFLRGQIDEVDDELALLLARRFALTATVQGFKDNPGKQGRDRVREAEIAARMAAHAPGLGEAAIARIMHLVIEESLDAYENSTGRERGTGLER